MNKLLAMIMGLSLAAASLPAVAADMPSSSSEGGAPKAQSPKGAQGEKKGEITQDVADLEKAIANKIRLINREMRQKLGEAEKEMKTKSAQIRREAQEKIAALKKEMQDKRGTPPQGEKAKDK